MSECLVNAAGKNRYGHVDGFLEMSDATKETHVYWKKTGKEIQKEKKMTTKKEQTVKLV